MVTTRTTARIAALADACPDVHTCTQLIARLRAEDRRRIARGIPRAHAPALNALHRRRAQLLFLHVRAALVQSARPSS